MKIFRYIVLLLILNVMPSLAFGAEEEMSGEEPLEASDETDGASTKKSSLLSGLPFSIQGYLLSDVRVGVEEPYGIVRNDNTFNSALKFELTKEMQARASFDLIFTGFTRADGLNDLSLRENVDPFRIESEDLYLDLYGMPFKWMDIRISRQTVVWGTADQFNPTDNINPDDFEDPLAFGKNIANNMLRVDSYFGDYTLSTFVIPVFRPAQIPLTTPEVFQSSPQGDEVFHATFDHTLSVFPLEVQEFADENLTIVFSEDAEFDLTLTPLVPEPSLENVMAGARFLGRLENLDWSLSYFYGRDDVPFLSKSVTESFEIPPDGVEINQSESGEIEAVKLTITKVTGSVELIYPRYHTLGFDLTTSLPFLFDMGFWSEVAVFFPEHQDIIVLYKDPLTPSDAPMTEIVIPFLDDPFAKCTVGFDYTFDSSFYLNFQFIRGFFDELGNQNLDNFIFAGLDKYWFSDSLLTRLFSGFDINDQSYLIYPELTWTPKDALTLNLGAILYRGEPLSKFGQPAAGTDTVFVKVKFNY